MITQCSRRKHRMDQDDRIVLTNEFSVKVGVHQGSALSPFLFITMMNCITRDTHGISCMLTTYSFRPLLGKHWETTSAVRKPGCSSTVLSWTSRRPSTWNRDPSRTVWWTSTNVAAESDKFKYLGRFITNEGRCSKGCQRTG